MRKVSILRAEQGRIPGLTLAIARPSDASSCFSRPFCGSTKTDVKSTGRPYRRTDSTKARIIFKCTQPEYTYVIQHQAQIKLVDWLEVIAL